MNSWDTLTALGGDLDTYLNNNYGGSVPIMDTEHDFRRLESMVDDESIPGVRVALYEQPEDVLTRVEANSAYDINQAYQMQLFFVVARIDDYDTMVEKELMDIKDQVFHWSTNKDDNGLDPGAVTSNELLTFEWDNINRLERQDEFSLLEINFGAYRQTRL